MPRPTYPTPAPWWWMRELRRRLIVAAIVSLPLFVLLWVADDRGESASPPIEGIDHAHE